MRTAEEWMKEIRREGYVNEEFINRIQADSRSSYIEALENYIIYLRKGFAQCEGFLNAHNWNWNPTLLHEGDILRDKLKGHKPCSAEFSSKL